MVYISSPKSSSDLNSEFKDKKLKDVVSGAAALIRIGSNCFKAVACRLCTSALAFEYVVRVCIVHH